MVRQLRRTFMKNSRLLMPLLLIFAVMLTLSIALVSRYRKQKMQDMPQTAAAEQVPAEDIVLEENAVPELNALFEQYYEAMADGDTDTIDRISSGLTEEEKIRIRELAKYIEYYPSVDVYSKTGPEEGSYVAYVLTNLKFFDHDWIIPGLQTMYVCTADDGSLYINSRQVQQSSVAEYISQVSYEDDVVDLSNETNAKYNQLVNSDDELASFLNELSSNIDLSVGQALAALQKDAQAEMTSASAQGDPGDGKKYLRSIDIVNIRKADSAESERLGQVSQGSVFELIEQLDNGWSRIRFNGTEAYVKSEFFEVISAEEAGAGQASSR